MPYEVRNEADLAAVMEAAGSGSSDGSDHRFEDLGAARYRLEIPTFAISIEVDRLRRERHELFGELSVLSASPSARNTGGALSIADFNLSSARARQDRARLLADRSGTETLDWVGVIEEFCQRVLVADRRGQPAVDLRMLSRPAADDALEIEGLRLVRRHPSIIFGDGGAAKSYTCLYFAGRLAERGMRVALFDWELAGEDHRDRLERLFGGAMPKIIYARCERPLVYEVDRLRRIARDEQIEFAVFDSVAFACDGPPEAAEVAGRYFRGVREIGVGSLHVAHITKGENADKKPFGSTFWHNGARSTWFAKASEPSDGTPTLTLGLFNRKCNMGALGQPVGFKIQFTETGTVFSRADVRDCPDLAESMSVRDRMSSALRRGAIEPKALAEEIGAKLDTITRTARRYKNKFIVLEGGKIALQEKEKSPP
jgi:hypothetical protein